jgi:CheY-like chemotaxis protein
MKVLLCDDNEEIVSTLKVFLEGRGYVVHAASSGYEAMKSLEGEPFDGVLTDYKMAGGDGGMLSHFCSERGIPCIVMTGYPSDYAKHYLAAGTTVMNKLDLLDLFQTDADIFKDRSLKVG